MMTKKNLIILAALVAGYYLLKKAGKI